MAVYLRLQVDPKLLILAPHFFAGDRLVLVKVSNIRFFCASLFLFHHISDYSQEVMFLPWNFHPLDQYQSQLCYHYWNTRGFLKNGLSGSGCKLLCFVLK